MTSDFYSATQISVLNVYYKTHPSQPVWDGRPPYQQPTLFAAKTVTDTADCWRVWCSANGICTYKHDMQALSVIGLVLFFIQVWSVVLTRYVNYRRTLSSNINWKCIMMQLLTVILILFSERAKERKEIKRKQERTTKWGGTECDLPSK